MFEALIFSSVNMVVWITFMHQFGGLKHQCNNDNLSSPCFGTEQVFAILYAY